MKNQPALLLNLSSSLRNTRAYDQHQSGLGKENNTYLPIGNLIHIYLLGT